MSEVENLKIRPYARLLTMLGDQLIKDEIIALMELIKNAYDADAEHVLIRFCNFNSDYSTRNDSAILIEDDGNGMNRDILVNAWMNPATPEKLKRKRKKQSTDKGRIMQGEKGIGRFAVFKLGRDIQIISRRQKQNGEKFVDESESDDEYVLSYDFSVYDRDFLTVQSTEKEIYLDDLEVSLEKRKACTIVKKVEEVGDVVTERKPYGTIIKICNLNGEWNAEKMEKVHQNVLRMQPIFSNLFIKDFSARILVNEVDYHSSTKRTEELQTVLDEKSVFIVEGEFQEAKRKIVFTLDDHNKKQEYVFRLDSPELLGISPLRNYLESLENREIECGSFGFKFYIMDLDIRASDKNTRYYLDLEEKKDVKAHRVYLYRDGIRVMPYGDPEDDWLMLDMLRGVERASGVFANDQVVGYVSISQKDNPNLRDKTNREGLIEEGYAREDLVKLCQLLLRYLRAKPYNRYLSEKRRFRSNRGSASFRGKHEGITSVRKAQKLGKKAVEDILDRIGDTWIQEIANSKNDEEIQQQAIEIVQSSVEEIQKKEKINWEAYDKVFNQLDNDFQKELDTLELRIQTTENLAAVGLSADTAYHDARILLTQIHKQIGSLVDSYEGIKEKWLDRQKVLDELLSIHSRLGTVSKLMNNIQRLFPSTKTKKGNINVYGVISKVRDLYAESLSKANASCSISKTTKESLIVECTDAVLLQVFINLFDNALYWLKTVKNERRIDIVIDCENRNVIFTDSGPGVKEEDLPYIFEPFYSGKGEEGKGLGLYIARQLLGRYNGTIEYKKDSSEELNGATFIVQFAKTEDLNG